MFKQAIPKTHFQPRAPCFHPLGLAAQGVSWDWGTADPRGAPSEQWNAWRENPICENTQWVGTKGSEQSPQLHLGTAGHSRWHWLSSITRSSWHWGQPKYNHTLTDIPQIGILQILCKQLWEIPSAAGWILPSCCPTQEKSLNIIAPGTCFWQNPAQYLCLLLIFRAHCTFEGTDTSKCYMSYRDFALVGKTFVCLLIVINIILTVGCSQNVCFLSSVLSFVSLKSDLLKEKKTSFN